MALYKYMFAEKYQLDFDKIRTIFIFPDYNKETEISLSKDTCEKVKDKYLQIISKIKNYGTQPLLYNDLDRRMH